MTRRARCPWSVLMTERWNREDWERYFARASDATTPPLSTGNGHRPSAPHGRGKVEPLSALGPVVETCHFIQWCKDHQAETPEPWWYAMLSNLVRCQGGREAAHTFSRDYPGYTPE